MSQRTREDTKREMDARRLPDPDSWQKKRRWRPKLGNGICQNPDCGKFDVRGLTRARASGCLLCHSCISSSTIRDALAARVASGWKP